MATHRHNEVHVFESQIRIVTDMIAALGSPLLFYAGHLRLNGAKPDMEVRYVTETPKWKPLLPGKKTDFLIFQLFCLLSVDRPSW
jgi:hypothetical protein